MAADMYRGQMAAGDTTVGSSRSGDGSARTYRSPSVQPRLEESAGRRGRQRVGIHQRVDVRDHLPGLVLGEPPGSGLTARNFKPVCDAPCRFPVSLLRAALGLAAIWTREARNPVT
jgi:hypothetical protein